jgi:hypothetical protein
MAVLFLRGAVGLVWRYVVVVVVVLTCNDFDGAGFTGELASACSEKKC